MRLVLLVPIAAAAALAGGAGLAHLLPALVLAALLAAGRYPGERRLARARAAPRRAPRPARQAAPLAPESRPPRGGLLMARGLAVRPPPAAPLRA
jgi:hypothetical protein